MTATNNTKTTTTHGGAREGAGRKAEGRSYVQVRLSDEEHATLRRLGGSSWVQETMRDVNARAREVLSKLDDVESDEDLLAALEDGELLATLDIDDEDAVNVAYALVEERIAERKARPLFIVDRRTGEVEETTVRDFESRFDIENYDAWRDACGTLDDYLDFDTLEDAEQAAKDLSEL